jgi:uncharacterized membrane protein
MSGHRQAALALYGLAEDDQRAILSELPAADQTVLRALLDELAELGFDKAANGDLAAPAAPAAGDAASALMQATPSAMQAVLRHEPASLVAQLISLRRFPWADAFMELMPSHRRVLVAEALRANVAIASAREQFLLESASAALRGLPPGPAGPVVPAAPSILSRLRAWIR